MIAALIEGLLDALAPPTCSACDVVLPPGERGFCVACASLLEPAVGAPRAAFLYGGPLADAIRRFKYGGRSDLAPVLAELGLPAALELSGRFDAVVPVPLHPRRERERGFNQASLIARAWASALGVPVRPRALRRVRDTPAQASLEVGRRAGNVRGAFRVDADIAGRVLLVDDVRTTGATLAECASALLVGGASRVHPLVLARVET
ncbi:MAG: ComF family protein [Sandaracinaceae bacterium]|nr:ComF family protein [Sandaracinaceae bacterium]